jgi:hypothetical protein
VRWVAELMAVLALVFPFQWVSRVAESVAVLALLLARLRVQSSESLAAVSG